MKEISAEVRDRSAKVKLLLMDVDGVMTDGKLYNFPGPDGSIFESKGFDSQDGIALQWLNRYGIRAGLISGRESAATAERAKQTRFRYVYQGHTEKIPILEEILRDSGMDPSEVGYIGDDLTDVVIMRRVGIAFAVSNARGEVKSCAHYVTESGGGNGAVREVVEIILKSQNFWEDVLRHYEVIP